MDFLAFTRLGHCPLARPQQLAGRSFPTSRPSRNAAPYVNVRKLRAARALQDGDGGDSGAPMASSEEAFETAEEVMAMFLAGEGNDGIMEFLPDSVIDSALERKRSKLGDRWVVT